MLHKERIIHIVVLFVVLRLMMLITFPADNLTLFGDYIYYYELASYSDQGHLPFIHYWSEYPPIFPFLSVGVYQLSQTIGGGYQAYVILLGLIMLAANTGNLVLVICLAERILGQEGTERIGWTYSALFVPMIYTWWNFDPLTTLSTLLALELLLSGRDDWSAVVMGLGVLTKLVPILVFPIVLLTRPWRRIMKYGLIVGAVVSAVAVPLVIIGGPMAVASFRSPMAWSSWETVWALLDGNLRTGLLVAPTDHFSIAKATTPVGNPPVVPEWIRLAVFGLISGAIFLKARVRDNPRRQVVFVCITLIVFFLWSKGWSPQWQSLIFPLLLLALPLRRSILFILVLSLVNLAEWPVLLSRGLNQWLYLTVPLRTAIFVLLLFELVPRVVDPQITDPRGARGTQAHADPPLCSR